MQNIHIHHSLPQGLEPAAATLYWEAFGPKLAKLLGPEARGRAFFEATVNHEAVITATNDAGDLLGIAAHQANGTGFSNAGVTTLFSHYGFGAAWRSVPLALLEREAPADTLQMDGICVNESTRGQGVGTKLFDALFEMARSKGFEKVTLDVINTNPRAKALYERLGFVATKEKNIGPMKHLLGFKSATKMVLTL